MRQVSRALLVIAGMAAFIEAHSFCSVIPNASATWQTVHHAGAEARLHAAVGRGGDACEPRWTGRAA